MHYQVPHYFLYLYWGCELWDTCHRFRYLWLHSRCFLFFTPPRNSPEICLPFWHHRLCKYLKLFLFSTCNLPSFLSSLNNFQFFSQSSNQNQSSHFYIYFFNLWKKKKVLVTFLWSSISMPVRIPHQYYSVSPSSSCYFCGLGKNTES